LERIEPAAQGKEKIQKKSKKLTGETQQKLPNIILDN